MSDSKSVPTSYIVRGMARAYEAALESGRTKNQKKENIRQARNDGDAGVLEQMAASRRVSAIIQATEAAVVATGPGERGDCVSVSSCTEERVMTLSSGQNEKVQRDSGIIIPQITTDAGRASLDCSSAENHVVQTSAPEEVKFPHEQENGGCDMSGIASGHPHKHPEGVTPPHGGDEKAMEESLCDAHRTTSGAVFRSCIHIHIRLPSNRITQKRWMTTVIQKDNDSGDRRYISTLIVPIRPPQNNNNFDLPSTLAGQDRNVFHCEQEQMVSPREKCKKESEMDCCLTDSTIPGDQVPLPTLAAWLNQYTFVEKRYISSVVVTLQHRLKRKDSNQQDAQSQQ